MRTFPLSRRAALTFAIAGCVLGIAGCPVPVNDETLLAGTWNVTTAADPDLQALSVQFNSNGVPVSATYRLNNQAAITSPIQNGSSSINGDQVLIQGTLLNSNFVFNGTLNSTNNTITGTLTTNFTVGDVQVTINNGAATFTRL